MDYVNQLILYLFIYFALPCWANETKSACKIITDKLEENKEREKNVH